MRRRIPCRPGNEKNSEKAINLTERKEYRKLLPQNEKIARRTEIRLTFDGVDITEDLNPWLLSMTYTDKESGEADDLQLELMDPEWIWLGNWLNQSADPKGAVITAAICQKNENGNGKVLNCGVFQVCGVDGSGPPATVSIKGTALPFTASVRTGIRNKAWENISLLEIADEIAAANNMTCMFESAANPYYDRREQLQESDIVFLQRLCGDAGLSLKATAGMLVLFNAAEYEQRGVVRTFDRKAGGILNYSFSTSFQDSNYDSCSVSYTDPLTQETYTGEFSAPDASGEGQVLQLNERVSSAAEAEELAKNRLRSKNKGEYSASLTIPGDVSMAAGLTVALTGYGAFDGTYIIESAGHSVSSGGYTTSLTLRQVLEGY